MKKFYDRYTEELYTDNLKETIEENPVVDHTIKIDTGNEPELVTKVIDPEPIASPIVEKSKDIEIPEAPIKKKGKNSYKKLTKKSRVKTLAEVEEEKPEPKPPTGGGNPDGTPPSGGTPGTPVLDTYTYTEARAA